MSLPENNLLRHLLATIAYRLKKSVHDAPSSYAEIDAGKGIRKPAEILNHMNSVLNFCIAEIDFSAVEKPLPKTWDGELTQFYQSLEKADLLLAHKLLTQETAFKLIQGPLADILTHIGQLAMLRRFADDPILKENFMKADIQHGKVRMEDQNLSSIN